MHHLAIWLLLVPVLAAAEPAKAASPSAEEIVILQALNDLRADVRRGDGPIQKAIKAKAIPITSVDWNRQEPPVTSRVPLIFSPALNAAARRLLTAGTNSPNDRKPYDAGPVLVAAGYGNAAAGGSAMFGSGATLMHAFASTCFNITGECIFPAPSTFRFDYYSARVGWAETWREAGVAVNANGKGFTAVIVLGAGTAPRHLGGVAYVDANRNGRYDPGEGRAGVTVSCGDQQMATGAGGAWWLDMATLDAATVAFAGEGTTSSRPVAKDAANLVLDWRMPIAADLKTADALLAEAEKAAAGNDAEKRRGAQATLQAGTLRLIVDDARQQRIDSLVAPVRDEFESCRTRILASLVEDPSVATACITEQKRHWAGAMPLWFKEAETLPGLRRQIVAVQIAPPADQAKPAAAVLAQLAKARSASRDPVLCAQYEAWEELLTGLLPSPAESRPAKPR